MRKKELKPFPNMEKVLTPFYAYVHICPNINFAEIIHEDLKEAPSTKIELIRKSEHVWLSNGSYKLRNNSILLQKSLEKSLETLQIV